ncbi:hypothetical protein DBV23_01170 [Edwardsiella ictaluri]|nr:hypothetical protein DBV23_01170 [Edwardsiella ictaluri]STP88244.1 Uncharacterised protein [Edwardsiella ictaluri]
MCRVGRVIRIGRYGGLVSLPISGVQTAADPLLFQCGLDNGMVARLTLYDGVPRYGYGVMKHGRIYSPPLTLPRQEGERAMVRCGRSVLPGATYCRFINVNYRYVVMDSIGHDRSFTGVRVFHERKLVSPLNCRNGGFVISDYHAQGLIRDTDTGDEGAYGYLLPDAG